jgi:hypothetical protein
MTEVRAEKLSQAAKKDIPFVPARLSWDVLSCYCLLALLTVSVLFITIPVFVQVSVVSLLLLYVHLLAR